MSRRGYTVIHGSNYEIITMIKFIRNTVAASVIMVGFFCYLFLLLCESH